MTIHLGPPPPPSLKDNHRVCDHNAMLAFPQEQISHYTTDYDLLKQIIEHVKNYDVKYHFTQKVPSSIDLKNYNTYDNKNNITCLL